MSRRSSSSDSPLSLFSLQDIITCLTGIMILLVLFLAVQTISENAPETMAELLDVESLDHRIADLLIEQAKLTAEISTLDAISELDGMSMVERVRAYQAAQQESLALSNAFHNAQERMRELERKSVELVDKLDAARQQKVDLAKMLREAEQLAEERSRRQVAFIPDRNESKVPHLIECSSNLVRVVSLQSPRRDREFAPEESAEHFVKLLKECSSGSEYFVFMLKPSGVSMGMDFYYAAKSTGFDAGYDTIEENARVFGRGVP